MADSTFTITLKVNDQELQEINATLQKMGKDPIKKKLEIDSQNVQSQLDKIAKGNPLKVQLQFDENVQKTARDIEILREQLTGLTGDAKSNVSKFLKVEGIDTLLGKLDDLKSSLQDITGYMGAKNIRKPQEIQDEIDYYKKLQETIKKTREDTQSLFIPFKDEKNGTVSKNAFNGPKYRSIIQQLFDEDAKKDIDMASGSVKKMFGYINEIWESGHDLSKSFVGDRSLLSIFEELNNIRIDNLTQQMKDFFSIGDDDNANKLKNQISQYQDLLTKFSQEKLFGDGLHVPKSFSQIGNTVLPELRDELSKAGAMAESAMRVGLDETTLASIRTAVEGLKDVTGKLKVEDGATLGMKAEDIQVITDSISSLKAEITTISTSLSDFLKPLQENAKPIEIKVDAQQALEQIEQVKTGIDGLNGKEADIKITNSEEIGTKIGEALNTEFQNALTQLGTNLETATTNVSSAVNTIKGDITSIIESFGQISKPFTDLDNSIKNSADNVDRLVTSMSRFTESEKTDSTYELSSEESIERITSAYELLNSKASTVDQLEPTKIFIDNLYESIGLLKDTIGDVEEKFASFAVDVSSTNSNLKGFSVGNFNRTMKSIMSNMTEKMPQEGFDRMDSLADSIRSLQYNLEKLSNIEGLPPIFDSLKSIQIDESLINNINNLAEAFKEFGQQLEVFGKNNDLTTALDSINQLLERSEALKDLSKVLKASEQKISAVREAVKTKEERQAEADAKQQTKVEKATAYDDLTRSVNEYVNARKAMAQGNKEGKFDDASIEKQKEHIDSLSESIRKNAKIWDEVKFNRATAPLKTLNDDLKKIQIANITKETKDAYSSAEAFMSKAEKYKDDAGISGYLENVKAKANEVKSLLDQIASGKITGEAIGNKGKELADLVSQSQTKLDAVVEQRQKDEKDQKKGDADYKAETQKLQTQAYKELTDAVNQYVKAREEIAKGNKNGLFNDSDIKKYRDNIVSSIRDIKGNERLFDQEKYANALNPLRGLEGRLKELSGQTQATDIIKDVQNALSSVDKYILNNESSIEKAGLSNHLTDIKTKADEVREALAKALDPSIVDADASSLEGFANQLRTMLAETKSNISSAKQTQAILSSQRMQSTGYNMVYNQAKRFSLTNSKVNEGVEKPEDMTAFGKAIVNLNTELAKTDDLMKGLNPKNLSDDDIIKITNQVNKLNDAYQQAQDLQPVDPLKQQQSVRNFDAWLSKNGVALSKYGKEVDELRKGITSAVTGGDLDKANAKIAEFEARLYEAGDIGKTFGQKLQTTFESLGRYLMTYASFYRVIGALKEGVNIAKEFDKAMTDIKMVSNETEKTYTNMQKASFNIAEQIGGDALTIQQSMGTWLRLGKSIEESQEAAKASNWLVNVSEFDNIDEASTALVSIKQAYDDLGYEDILDKLNAVGDSFSSSTDALASGLQNSAAALVTQGNDIDQALALLTAGNQITQDISKTSAGVRTISLKIAGFHSPKIQ